MTLHLFEMAVQHLHNWFLHGVEFFSFGLVVSIVIGVVDEGRGLNPFSLAQTRFFAMLSFFLRLRMGVVYCSRYIAPFIFVGLYNLSEFFSV